MITWQGFVTVRFAEFLVEDAALDWLRGLGWQVCARQRRVSVSVSVSPAIPRHFPRRTPAPTLGSHCKADNLSF